MIKHVKIFFLGYLTFFLLTLPINAKLLNPENLADPTSLPGKAAKAVDWYQKGKDANDKASLLDPPTDGDAEKNYNPPGMPTMPVSCEKNNKKGCEECYKNAYEELRKLRQYFEQLRTIYAATDDYTKAQIAFGDGMSGSAGVGALQWNVERAKIQKSFNDFKKAYKAKYNELLGRLENVLKEIGNCEAKYFGNEDWYSRYGFVFLSFIAMYYQR